MQELEPESYPLLLVSRQALGLLSLLGSMSPPALVPLWSALVKELLQPE